MKITINFENGMELVVKPENLSIGDAKDASGAPVVSIAFKTDVSVVPFLFFKNTALATKEEVAARAIALSPSGSPAEPPQGSVAKLAAAEVAPGKNRMRKVAPTA